MSQLGQLKAQIDAVASQSKSMAGHLDGFRAQFSSSVSQVQSTIGGSAQGKDRQLIADITAAQRQVEQASAALQRAAASAQQYGASL